MTISDGSGRFLEPAAAAATVGDKRRGVGEHHRRCPALRPRAETGCTVVIAAARTDINGERLARKEHARAAKLRHAAATTGTADGVAAATAAADHERVHQRQVLARCQRNRGRSIGEDVNMTARYSQRAHRIIRRGDKFVGYHVENRECRH